MRGTTKNAPYPQTEGMLAETMSNYGKKLGEDSDLGKVSGKLRQGMGGMTKLSYNLKLVTFVQHDLRISKK